MTKRVVFWGGFGGVNLGDEAILRAASNLYREDDASTKHYVLTKERVSACTASDYEKHGLVAITLRNPLAVCRVLRGARLHVGGGQLIDDCGLLWPCIWTSLIIVVARALAATVHIRGIGVEHVQSSLKRLLVRSCYSLGDQITVRDSYSQRALEQIGIESSRIETTADTVFSLYDEFAEFRTVSKRSFAVLVVARDPKRPHDSLANYIDFIKRSEKELAARGLTLIAISHDVRTAFDAGLVKELEKAIENSAVRFACPQVLDDVIGIYAQARIVVSSRMHPLIIGALCGAIPHAFGDSNKVASLVTRLGGSLNSLTDLSDFNWQDFSEDSAKHDTLLQKLRQLSIVSRRGFRKS